MGRALHIFIALVFAATSAIATPFAVCQHANAKAHASALVSSDAIKAVAAQIEDSAEAAAKKQGSVADAAGALATVLPPSDQWLMFRLFARSIGWFADVPALLAGRAAPPLLTPPLN